MALTSSLTQEGSLVDNLLHFLADEGPAGLLEGYVKLGTWVDNTLDLYKVCWDPITLCLVSREGCLTIC